MSDSLNPLVSVLIPTFNRSKLVVRAIRSALQQTYKNIEVVVVDDGSTDDTREAIAALGDSRVRYFYTPNRGRSAARNLGLTKILGDYIAFLDSDDEFYPQKIEVQLARMRAVPGCEISYTNADIFDEVLNLRFAHVYPARRYDDFYYDIALYCPIILLLPTIIMSTALQKRVGDFDTSLDRFEDTDYWRRCSLQTQFLGLDECFTLVYTHSGNQMEDPRVLFAAVKKYYEKVLREDSSRKSVSQIKKCINAFLFHYGNAVFSRRPYRRASRRFFWTGISMRPWSAIHWVYYFGSFLPGRAGEIFVNLMMRSVARLLHIILVPLRSLLGAVRQK